MVGWIASISSKYYKIIEFKRGEKNFKFSIKNIPDSLNKVSVWVQRYGEYEVVLNGKSESIPIKRKNKIVGNLLLSIQ